MSLLPPLTQDYTVNATAYLAGIDEMIAGTEKLGESIDTVVASTAQMSGAAGAVATADARAGEAADAAAAAVDRQVTAMDALAGTMEDSIAAIDANSAALDGQALSADRAAGASDTAAGSAAGLGSKGKLGFMALAAGVAYAVVKAADFQQQMVRLQTQAGLTRTDMGKLGNTVLQIGDQTGQTGTAIAAALYHPISAGLNLATALGLVRNAAKLAAISGSDLDTTTYALSSVMKSYNLNAGDAANTSALLNSIVGQGDMKFQDFVSSVSNWAPSSAQMGISIHSMGAALAYLTDRGNSATSAATRLTMGLSMVTSPSKEAASFLGALGLQSSNVALKNENLATVMNSVGLTSSKVAGMLQKPDGIYVALTHIQAAFHHAGLSATQADAVMAKIFGGGRSDKAILALMQNLGGLQKKYADIGKGVSQYGADWKKTQETLSFQFHKTLASVENLAISFGRMLIPAVTKVLTVVGKFFSFLESHPALAKMAGAFVAVAVAGAAVSAVIAGLVTAFDPITLVVAAVAALAVGLYELYQHSKLVRDIVADVGRFFAGIWQDAMQAAGAVVKWFVDGPLAFIKAQLAIFSQFWAAHGAEIDRIAKAVWELIVLYVKVNWDIIKAYITVGLTVLKAIWNVAWAVIRDTVKTVWSLIGSYIHMAVQLITGIISIGLDLITGHWAKAGDDLRHLTSQMFDDVRHIIATIVGGFGHLLFDAGKAAVEGFINGIKAMIGAVGHVASDVGHAALSAVKDALGVFSPSRMMYEVGQNTGQGLANGILSTEATVVRAATIVGQAASAAIVSSLASSLHQATSGTGSDMLRIGGSSGPYSGASGNAGSVLAALMGNSFGQALSGGGGGGGGGGGSSLPAGVSKAVSAAQTKAASLAKAMHDIGLELAGGFARGISEDTASQVKTAVDKLIGYVKSAFDAGGISYGQASGMTDWLNRDNSRLQDLANKRAAILKEITTAKAFSVTTEKAAASFASLSNITGAMPTGSAVTSSGILAGLQADLGKIRQFNDAIKRLSKIGLDHRLLIQIIQAGPDAGLPIAQALLDGPVSAIRSMNRAESAITSSARALGHEASDAMYDSGKDAGKGFLSGLEHHQRAIEQMMKKIAKSMVDTIRRELGIHSPSTVGHFHGFMFAQGIADGIDDGSGKVSAASMRLSKAASLGDGGALGSGGGHVTNYNVKVEVNVPGGFVGSDAQLAAKLAPAIQKALLQQQRGNPTPQLVLPGR